MSAARPLDPPSARAWDAAATVVDPEVPVLTIADLGVLRDAQAAGDVAVVTVTPTYSGCPAMETISNDVVAAVTGAGFERCDVRVVLHPAWSTDDMSDEGKRKLTEFGIAPPTGRRFSGPIPLSVSIRCPRCGSGNTAELSHFGSTSCKALWQCRDCAEPFDHFKDL